MHKKTDFVNTGTFPEEKFTARLIQTSTVLFPEVQFGTIAAADVNFNLEASEILSFKKMIRFDFESVSEPNWVQRSCFMSLFIYDEALHSQFWRS